MHKVQAGKHIKRGRHTYSERGRHTYKAQAGTHMHTASTHIHRASTHTQRERSQTHTSPLPHCTALITLSAERARIAAERRPIERLNDSMNE